MFDRLDLLIREGRDGMVDALTGLLAIPSCKGEPEPGAPFGLDTRRSLDYVVSLGSAMGFHTASIDGMAGFIEFGTGLRMVAALGHLDVVPPGDGWTGDPFVPVIDIEGKVIARGAIDDKGPVIACLFAMKALRDAGFVLPSRVRLILGLDEESGSACMERYVRTEEIPDAGFTPDADFPAIYAEKGIMHLAFRYDAGNPGDGKPHRDTIAMQGGVRANVVPSRCTLKIHEGSSGTYEHVFSGIPAHGSTPEQGDNAISHAMEEAGSRLSSLGFRHPLVDFFNRKIGYETDGTSAGVAFSDEPSGALTLNAGIIVLDGIHAELTVDIRYPVTMDRENLLSRLRASADPYGVTLTVLHAQHPLHVDPSSPMIQTLTGIYRDVTGRNEPPVAIGGGTYARSMPNIVAFGPNIGGDPEMAHKADEYITIDRMETCARIYARAFVALSAQVVGADREGVQ